ncbi:hypothetical protein ACYSNR_12055 [Enterococcus sp. LJL128]|uniref:hypothetical protein n=1 Tax=Enterococcus sp. LJL51 TaxID=3416656 RepID=UPI003CF5F1C2
MKIKIKKETHWGCLKPLNVYVNDEKRGKLFNCISLNLDVQPGDEISFKEGPFPAFKKIEVAPHTKEIVIKNSNNLQPLFVKFLLLFFVFVISCLVIQSMLFFAAFVIALFLGFVSIFRLQSYQFEIDGHPEWQSLERSIKLFK